MNLHARLPQRQPHGTCMLCQHGAVMNKISCGAPNNQNHIQHLRCNTATQRLLDTSLGINTRQQVVTASMPVLGFGATHHGHHTLLPSHDDHAHHHAPTKSLSFGSLSGLSRWDKFKDLGQDRSARIFALRSKHDGEILSVAGPALCTMLLDPAMSAINSGG